MSFKTIKTKKAKITLGVLSLVSFLFISSVLVNNALNKTNDDSTGIRDDQTNTIEEEIIQQSEELENIEQIIYSGTKSAPQAATTITVGILNSNEGSNYSGWTGGNSNSYDRVQTVLDARGYNTIILENSDLTSGSSLETLGVDVLVIPDNGPTDSAAQAIGEWVRDYDGPIVTMDSSVVVLFYEGLITGDYHVSNFYGEFWTYSSPSEGKVGNVDHDVMASYSLNEIIAGTSGNSQMFNTEIKTELGNNSQYYTGLVQNPTTTNNDLVWSLDLPNQGRIVQMWDQYPEDATHDTENLFCAAIDWVQGEEIPRPDLESQFISAPESALEGNIVTYKARVTNVGTGTASNTTFKLDIGSITQESATNLTLAPGQYHELTANYTMPSSGSVLVEAIAPSITGESILNNNEKTTTTSITSNPAPALSYEPEAEYYHGTTENEVEITATDESPGQYQFSIDGTQIESGLAWQDGVAFSINIDGLSLGYHSLTVEVFDSYGIQSTASIDINVIEVPIDETAPGLDAQADQILESNYTEAIISWTATDDNPANYTITKNGVEIVSSQLWNNGVSITCEIPEGLDLGSYIYEITVTDQAGNINQDAVNVTVQDTNSPTISNSTDLKTEYDYSNVEITWTATDDNPANYTITKNGVEIVSSQVWFSGSAITYSIPEGFTLGTYSYEITFVDESGNAASDIILLTVVDREAPSAILPENLTVIEGYDAFNITWTAQDDFPATMNVSLNGDLLLENEIWINSSSTILTIPEGLDTGIHNINFSFSDTTGNLLQISIDLTVNELPPQEPIENDTNENENLENPENSDDDNNQESEKKPFSITKLEIWGIAGALGGLVFLGAFFLSQKDEI